LDTFLRLQIWEWVRPEKHPHKRSFFAADSEHVDVKNPTKRKVVQKPGIAADVARTGRPINVCDVAACCSVLQRVAACCSVLQRVAACCSVLQCVAACCSVLQCVAVPLTLHELEGPFDYVALQCGAACCSVLQRVAACCSVLQCVEQTGRPIQVCGVAACCSVL